MTSFRDLAPVSEQLRGCGVTSGHFSVAVFALTADNWSPHEILRAVLPRGEEGVSSFSIIGHIVHLNLRSADTRAQRANLKFKIKPLNFIMRIHSSCKPTNHCFNH